MKKFIIANWKMNMSAKSVEDWLKTMAEISRGYNFANVEVIIAPSFIHIEKTTRLIELLNLPFSVASQDVNSKESGTVTSGISANQVSDYCKYTIVNHSETKTSLEDLELKLNNIRKSKLNPILCFVDEKALPKEILPTDIIAWEDPANISVNGIYKPKEIIEVITRAKELKKDSFSSNQVLYGGSVTKDFSRDLAKIHELDGVLVGNASLDPNHLFEIIKIYNF